jgi:hypothetical protein
VGLVDATISIVALLCAAHNPLAFFLRKLTKETAEAG